MLAQDEEEGDVKSICARLVIRRSGDLGAYRSGFAVDKEVLRSPRTIDQVEGFVD